jgi:hypothetical protein
MTNCSVTVLINQSIYLVYVYRLNLPNLVVCYSEFAMKLVFHGRLHYGIYIQFHFNVEFCITTCDTKLGKFIEHVFQFVVRSSIEVHILNT